MKRTTNIFFTSDFHIGHANSIIFDERPFRDLEHMHEVLINNYNSTVRDTDTCYFLGDMGLCNSEYLTKVVSQLNGTKVLVLGNHDKGIDAMYKVGFDVVLHGATMQIAGERVTMSHCPLLGVYREDTSSMTRSELKENWHGESREKYRIFSTHDNGQFHLHGHVHSPNKGRSQKILGQQYDVGVCANNFRPVSISVIESWIAKTKGASDERINASTE